EIRAIDFFDSPRGHEFEALLHKMEKKPDATEAPPKIDPRNYRGKTWLTRPCPEIDRVGSAWLIRNFIDADSKFIFATSPQPGAVSFDMLDADFSHAG